MIQIEELKSYLECDDNFLLELLEQFRTESSICKQELQQGLQEMDLVKVKSTAHRMLSSTRIFGFDTLTAVLEKLQRYDVWDPVMHKLDIESFENILKQNLLDIAALERQIAKSS